MPELPEVETVARLIRPKLLGRRIEGVEINWPRSVNGCTPRAFARRLRGARFVAVGRRAKYVRMDLERDGEPAGVLLCHLRMTGRLHVQNDAPPYTRLSILLDKQALHFVDVRKFGRMGHWSDPAPVFDRLGPEPLEDGFSTDWFVAALRARKRALKPLLLDQSFLAGLGNIYVDEALHRSRLHPQRRANTLRRPQVEKLRGEIRATLAEAVEREGSSFDSFYRTPEGQPGSYQDQFQVYGRQGRPCSTCGRTLVRIVVAQRGTHLCTRCQPAPRGL